MTPGSRPRDAPSRAQLILAGSVALAVVILSLAVVMNSLLVTETNTVGASLDRVDEARTIDHEARRGVQSLVHRLNHRDRNTTGAGLASAVSGNVSAYSAALAESHVRSGSVFVNVSYQNDSSAFGTRFVQAGDALVTEPGSNASDWEPVDDPRTLGWFTMNVDVEATDRQPVFVNATGAGGDWVNVSLNRTVDDDLAVASDASFTGSTSTTCRPSGGRVLVDFLAGETLSGGCSFTAFGDLDQPVTVRVTHGDRAVARYEMAVNESVGYAACDSSVARGEACQSPLVWTANVTTLVRSDTVDYTNSDNVSVYDP